MESTGPSSLHIYYRMRGKSANPSPRDHIIKDGEALCNYGVDVPEEESLKPLSEVSKAEWAIFLGKYSNLCDECARSLEHYDVVPDDLPEESPEYICPVCSEVADSVDFRFDTACIRHKSEERSFPPSFETHRIPRELYDIWRMNPNEPFTYPNLKQFIDEHPRVFRPQEYWNQIESQR